MFRTIDPESAQIALKNLFLPREYVQTGEKEVEVPKSMKDLTTVEFEAYLMSCRVFASEELQMIIPLPNEPVFCSTDEPRPQ